jgi:hypothetical protein
MQIKNKNCENTTGPFTYKNNLKIPQNIVPIMYSTG